MKKKKRIAVFISAFIVLVSFAKYKLAKDVSKLEQKVKIRSENLNDDYLIVSHRGFSSLEVENTKEAIVLAASKDYIDAIEFDIRMTKDGKIVLCHDNKIHGKFLELNSISSLTYDEIMNHEFIYLRLPALDMRMNPENILVRKRQLNLNGKTYNIIGLKEGISSCQDKVILIDIKFDNNYEEFTEEIKKELEGIDTSNIIFQSLDVEGIKYFQEHTSFNCQVLISSKDQFPYMNYFRNIGLNYNVVSYELIHSLLSQGKQVYIWTVNSPQVLASLIEKLGEYYKDVYYITNYPDLIVTKLDQEKVLKNN